MGNLQEAAHGKRMGRLARNDCMCASHLAGCDTGTDLPISNSLELCWVIECLKQTNSVLIVAVAIHPLVTAFRCIHNSKRTHMHT